ncbi:GNAT family N-acetyltransferase [Defluviimonas sp. SAOS-178_SWC]|uniref:GNAT family N-acetyltransferase n=1 Tax=Defluviimonas sp. SAOS-178_SWC TaxID=3121287 RepID=UPI003221B854
MTAIRFDEARPEDLDTVIAISAMTHREHQDRLPEAFPPGLDNELNQMFRDHFKAPHGAPAFPATRILLCRDGGRIVGHAFLRVQRFDRQTDDHDVVGTVLDISLLPEYRRKGLGTRLLDEARQTLKEMGATRVDAHIWRGNHASAATFRGQGFEMLYGLYVQRLSEPVAGRVHRAEKPETWRGKMLIGSLALNLFLLLWLMVFLNR